MRGSPCNESPLSSAPASCRYCCSSCHGLPHSPVAPRTDVLRVLRNFLHQNRGAEVSLPPLVRGGSDHRTDMFHRRASSAPTSSASRFRVSGAHLATKTVLRTQIPAKSQNVHVCPTASIKGRNNKLTRKFDNQFTVAPALAPLARWSDGKSSPSMTQNTGPRPTPNATMYNIMNTSISTGPRLTANATPSRPMVTAIPTREPSNKGLRPTRSTRYRDSTVTATLTTPMKIE